jgi:xanthine dehydrogenase accessory factor
VISFTCRWGISHAGTLRCDRVEAGVDEHELERFSGPSGPDIGAVSPSETAVSILAEILARRAGRAGGPLPTAAGRNHARVD